MMDVARRIEIGSTSALVRVDPDTPEKVITRDYIVRQVHQLAQVLARVLFLKSNEQHREAIGEIDQALQNVAGLDDLLHPGLTRDEVLVSCRTDGDFSADKAVAVAELLAERGVLLEGENESRICFQYALWLYEGAMAAGGAVPMDIMQQIAWLRSECTG